MPFFLQLANLVMLIPFSPAFSMMVMAGIVLLPALLPVTITDHSVKFNNTTSNGTFSELDKFSMGHIGVCIAFSYYQLSIQIKNY